MTYDPGRQGGGRYAGTAHEWRDPLRAQRDPVAGDSGRVGSNHEYRPRRPNKTWLGRFISSYGWPAYTLPVLVAMTAVVIFQTVTGSSNPGRVSEGPMQVPRTIGAMGTAIIDTPPKGLTQFDANLPTGILPDGGPYTKDGAKTWHIVPGTEPQAGQGTAKVFTYTVEVEDGIDTTSFGGDDDFAQMITQTLHNPRSWTHNSQFALIRVDTGTPDFRVSLTSPMTVREGCGYGIELETSCFNPSYGPEKEPRVFINEARWVRGAVPFQGDVGSYRQYMINHEVGHAIGYEHHEPCGDNGQLAPVMMEQTFGTSNNDAAKFDPDTVTLDGKTCRVNPWPYPFA